MCAACYRSSEYAFKRRRTIRSTQEDGQRTITTLSIVSHCPTCGRHSTTLASDMVAHKHYSLSEIQQVLEGKSDYSLASERTRCYWRAWIRSVIATVVKKVQHYCNSLFSKEHIYHALIEYLASLEEHWLRVLLDLFAIKYNNLCTFLLVVSPIITDGGKKTHRGRHLAGVSSHHTERKPP